jgi:hypothetical protein
MWAVGKPVERPTGNNVNRSFPQIWGSIGKIDGYFIHSKT